MRHAPTLEARKDASFSTTPLAMEKAIMLMELMERPLSLRACIGTMNRFVLVLVVLLLEAKLTTSWKNVYPALV